MSTVDELLDSLSETDYIPTSGHIVIDNQRFIHVPDELKRIAVQHDHNIERTTFDCPRYWDGVDMSLMKIYVNYMRADGEMGMTLMENVCVDEADEMIMHFDWIVSRHTTLCKGPIRFLVCAKNVNAEGYESVHWNTELNDECHISEGMEVADIVIEKHQDIITQLLVRMDTVEKGFADNRVDFENLSTEVKGYTERINTANTNAANALSTANNAESKADAAVNTSNEALNNSNTALSIAKGANQAQSFDTLDDLHVWLSDENNAGVCGVGDNLYIADSNASDYWVSEVLTEPDPDTGFYYKIEELETQSINLLVDDALSETSTNPVQNKVIATALGDISTALANINSILETTLGV